MMIALYEMVRIQSEELPGEIMLQNRLIREVKVFRPFQIHIDDIHFLSRMIEDMFLLIKCTVSLRADLGTDGKNKDADHP
jgi:hypothetical protein